MSKIDDALLSVASLADRTERARELAGLISTLFKLRGVVLIVTGEMAFHSYANSSLEYPELELTPFAGKLTPRLLQEIMAGQLHAEGGVTRWSLAGLPVRIQMEPSLAKRELCRDLTTDYGVVKLLPAEEIAAERILAAVYPKANPVAYEEALALLMHGLLDTFQMNWIALGKLCHQPEYRVGEELARLRQEAKRKIDELGLGIDPVGYPPAPVAPVAPPALEPLEIAELLPA